MNYKNVKQANKNISIIVVVLLALVLLGGLIASLGFAFNWWGNTLPTSTYVLNIESIDDIVDLEFEKEDFSSYLDEKAKYAIENRDTFDGSYPEDLKESSWASIILNVESYGVDYVKPEVGFYDIAFKINGKTYSAENVQYFEASSEKWYSFEVENDSIYFGITDMGALSTLGETDIVEGSSIILYTKSFYIETFELVKFEKVADFSNVQ